jgi:RHS repeat-associated protein
LPQRSQRISALQRSYPLATRADGVCYTPACLAAAKTGYLHGNHLNSTTLTTDQSGKLVAEARYLPYDGLRWESGAAVTDFGFTGQRAERGFGLLDYNARYYSPMLGRFVSADSLVPNPGAPQALNRYAYARNNPLGYTDPSGHQGEPWLHRIISGIQEWVILHDPCTLSEDPNCISISKALFGSVQRPKPEDVMGPLLIDGGEAEKLRQVVDAANTAAELASVVNQFGGRLDPEDIRYSQETYSIHGKIYDENDDWTGEWYSVEENIEFLRNNPDKDLEGGPIRIFVIEAYMDEWGSMTKYGYTGDPRNLENGQVYTLDHRRLVAYREAGRDSIPVQLAGEDEIINERYKFSTPNYGTEIFP